MNFVPEWYKKELGASKKRYKSFVFVLFVLLLVHLFYLNNRQANVDLFQDEIKNELKANEEKIVGTQKITSEITRINKNLQNQKRFLHIENTQIVVEALSELLSVFDAKNPEVVLISQPENQKGLTHINNLQNIEVSMIFILQQKYTDEVLNYLVNSPFVINLTKLSTYEKQSNLISNWEITIPTDNNAENQINLSKYDIFPNLNSVKLEPKKIEVVDNSKANCTLPELDGIMYQNNESESLIFLNGKIHRLNDQINCYTIVQISSQKVQLKDNENQIFEIFTKLNNN